MKNLTLQIKKSSFRHIYWFARYLLNVDEFGALGKSKEKELLQIVAVLEDTMSNHTFTDDEKLTIAKNTFLRILDCVKVDSKAYFGAERLLYILDDEIQTLDDVEMFCITMKYVVSPINIALEKVPNDDKEFCYMTAKQILDSLGERSVGKVVSTWDRLGTKWCLEKEREIVTYEFSNLLFNLSKLEIEHNALDDNLAMTAFVQEFERRLGQKRKARGGTSLETVVSFLFDYYGFKSTEKPSHFDSDIEVDKWFMCKDGWSIGISCKRTLRERWKQLSQADRGTLSHFKIKELWHITTFDRDLSDDKIVRLGEQGQVFYLMDDSPVYLRCSQHEGMKQYVRPLSLLVNDIRARIK